VVEDDSDFEFIRLTGSCQSNSNLGLEVVHSVIVDERDLERKISQDLLAWYRKNARQLPWRETRDPYAVWVSEIMLQQTRVETVIPYYQNWLREFPDLKALADAEEDRVLKVWEGLGYYSRARNLRKAAQVLLSEHGGQLPRDIKTLQSLPGIGRYTAGAIASIAYGVPAPILDGNLRRVFTRFFNIQSPIQTTETEKVLWKIAEEVLPDRDPGDFNQALMELGALICLPVNPDCENCPLVDDCQAYRLGCQESLPVRKQQDPPPHYQVAAAVIEKEGRVLLAKRPPDGLLGGLWEFPGGKQESSESLPETLKREILEELELDIQVGEALGTYQHAYTHYSVTLHAFRCTGPSTEIRLNYHTDIAWAELKTLDSYPMGKLDRLIADRLQSPSMTP
jgi:A/G-specific adenine glycosylase